MADTIGIVLAEVLKGKREIARDTIRSPPYQTGPSMHGNANLSLRFFDMIRTIHIIFYDLNFYDQ